MRYDSAARLAHLQSLAAAKNVAAREAQRSRNELASALAAARSETERAAADYKNAGDVPGLRARADELAAALRDADAAAALARDRATDAGRLLAACADHARTNRLPLPVAVGMRGADPQGHAKAQGVVR